MGNFRGSVKPQDANGYFRKLREKYGGVEPSIVWTNRDFDITAKTMQALTLSFYVISCRSSFDFSFIKRHAPKPVSLKRTIQSKQVACQLRYLSNAEAGNAARWMLSQKETIDSVMNALNRSMLAMGSSGPWPDALAAMTGERQLNASAFLEYFQRIHDSLLKTNLRRGVRICWEESDGELALGWWRLPKPVEVAEFVFRLKSSHKCRHRCN